MTEKSPHYRWLLTPYFAFGFVIFVVLLVSQGTAAQTEPRDRQPDRLTQLKNNAAGDGTIRVIVQLDVPFEAEGVLSGAGARRTQQSRIATAQARISEQMATEMEAITQFKHIPFMAIRIDSDAIEQLAALPEVLSIQEDEPVPTALGSSIPIIGADSAWTNGYTGAGQAVAILDTGVDLDHPAFNTGGARIVAEGCFSTTDSGYGSVSVCPGGVESSIAPGSGTDCVAAATGFSGAQSNCTHGTHVAGIAAGNDGTTKGVAPAADIISIQIFSLFTSSAYCGGASGCALTYTSDQILGLERIYELRNAYDIAAVNMSLGGSTPYAAACDSDGRKAAIDNLRSVGIATVIASGNNGYRDGISKPACISSAVSVGATEDSDQIASFSNVSPILDLLAPGSSILAAVPNGYGTKSGTSMATPHVAGAWAVYKQAVPNASVEDVLAAFQSSGTLVDDARSGGIEAGIPRINIDQAISQYVPGLTVEVSASQQYALPGGALGFTITVRNETAVTATSTHITNPVPAGFILDPGSLSSDASTTGVLGGAEISWETGQSLSPGQSLSRSFSGTVDPAATSGAVIQNSAFASSASMEETRTDTAVTQIIAVASCDFEDGFEAGALGPSWSVETTEDGRVALTNLLPHSGSTSLLLDDSTSGGSYSEASAIVTIDLSGQSEIALDFDWYDMADEFDTAYDGVFIRERPGAAWVKVYHFAGNTIDRYQSASLDLVQLAASSGVQLTNQFQVKFSFYDNYPASFGNLNGGDGYLIDNVTFRCEPAGLTLTKSLNATSLDPGQRVTVTMALRNNSATTSTNIVITSDIPSGFAFAGPVTLQGGNGNVAQDAGDLPTILSGASIPSGGQITLILPLRVDTGLKGGTVLTMRTSAASDQYSGAETIDLVSVVMNVPPHAASDSATTPHHMPITLSPLGNDTDANGDSLAILDVSRPDQGGSAVVTGSTIRYIPKQRFAGVETVAYTVSDGVGGTDVGTISILVPNVAPQANNDETAAPPNTPVTYPVLVNDTDVNEDTLSILSIEQPSSGSASIQGDRIVYSSAPGFSGVATINYTMTDGQGGQSSAQLAVHVAPDANGAPVAQMDTSSVERNTPVEIRVLDNDMDPNLDALTLLAVSQPRFGTAVMQGDAITYTPQPGFVGVDSFQYTIQDAKGSTTTAAVFVSVAMENTEIFEVDPDATVEQTIYSTDNRITLTIPVGALPSTTRQIAYTTPGNSLTRPAMQGVGINFALNVGDGSQIFTGSPTFDPPLVLTLKYDPATLPSGIVEDNLQLFYYNDTSETWEAISITGRDPVNNTVTASLAHFTDFSLSASYELYLPIVTNGN